MIQYIHSFHVLVVHGLGSYLVLPSLLLWLTVPTGIPVVNGYTFFYLQAEFLSQGSVFLYRNSARVVACFVKIPTLVMRYFMTSKEWSHFSDGPERFFPHYTDVLITLSCRGTNHCLQLGIPFVVMFIGYILDKFR